MSLILIIQMSWISIKPFKMNKATNKINWISVQAFVNSLDDLKRWNVQLHYRKCTKIKRLICMFRMDIWSLCYGIRQRSEKYQTTKGGTCQSAGMRCKIKTWALKVVAAASDCVSAFIFQRIHIFFVGWWDEGRLLQTITLQLHAFALCVLHTFNVHFQCM